MGWIRSRAHDARRRCRHGVETLEARTVLSAVIGPAALVAPMPAGDTPPAPPAGATNFDAIIGASAARSTYNVNGAGMTVAVIDTGVNYNNEDLGGGFGPGHKVVAGFDFSTGTADPYAVTWQHGTAVAGLIAGSDPKAPGVAPGADIVALRVFGNDNQGDFTRVADALQWVIDNHATYNITVANLSISDGNSYTRNWFANDGGIGQRITDLIHQLDGMNIPVVTATGNSFTGFQGVGFTAIVGDSISVTATDATDHILPNAQRLGPSEGGGLATDMAAPGQNLYAPVDGNNFTTVTGTSFAAPLVSGSIVLLQQIYQGRFGHLPSVSDLDTWLQAGGDTIHDGVTGIDIGRLDIPRAAAAIPSAPVVAPPTSLPPTGTTDSNPTPGNGTGTVPTTTGGGTGQTSGSTVELIFNGQTLGSVSSSQLGPGWANFFSLFTGTLTKVQGWGKTGSVPSGTTTAPNLLSGVNFTKIQGWSNVPATNQPAPAGTLAALHHARHSGFAGARRHH